MACNISGRFGNHCLEIYKLFEAADRLKVPFENLFLDEKHYSPMFENIRSNFHPTSEIDCIKFDVIYDCKLIEDNPPPGNIRISGYEWVYPNTPSELALFNWIFDAPQLRLTIFEKYKDIFVKPTVGFTVRRGDFHGLKGSHRWLEEDKAVRIVNTLRELHQNNVRFVVSSDEINNADVRKLFDGTDVFFVEDNPENTVMLLSFCDYIVNNGTLSRSADRLSGKYESTFGQIAQCLCASRHFAGLNLRS